MSDGTGQRTPSGGPERGPDTEPESSSSGQELRVTPGTSSNAASSADGGGEARLSPGDPDYCRRILVRDAKGTIREIVLPRGLDLDRPKRTRTSFTAEQLDRLETEYQRCQYVVGRQRTGLAAQLSLTEAQVKVWFQNRRTKQKKDRTRDLRNRSPATSESKATCDILRLLEQRQLLGPAGLVSPPSDGCGLVSTTRSSPDLVSCPLGLSAPGVTTTPGLSVSPRMTISPGQTRPPELTTAPGLLISPGLSVSPRLTSSPRQTVTPGQTRPPGLIASLGLAISPGLSVSLRQSVSPGQTRPLGLTASSGLSSPQD